MSHLRINSHCKTKDIASKHQAPQSSSLLTAYGEIPSPYLSPDYGETAFDHFLRIEALPLPIGLEVIPISFIVVARSFGIESTAA